MNLLPMNQQQLLAPRMLTAARCEQSKISSISMGDLIMASLTIHYAKVADLVPFKRNARTHSRKQIRQIAESIKVFGFTNPLIIDKENMILAGHGRLAAAKELGFSELPCVRIESMTPAQKRAYVIADNKLALNAGWDEELLALELKDLLEIDHSFEIAVTGFEISEVDGLIEGLAVEDAPASREEHLPAIAIHPITAIGDVWMLGPHRLICGDALSPNVVETLMAGELAEMVFTDPPYNVPIDGHVSGLGAVKHREFAMASGELSSTQFIEFLAKALRNLADYSKDGSIHFICMDWRHVSELKDAGDSIYSELKNLIVWVKDNGGMGTFYRSRHELILAFKKGHAPHINSFELGQHGRYRTNVWTYRGQNSFGSGRKDALEQHPTVKPVALIADAVKDVSKRNGIVLDLFGGSGSTTIAAHKTGRRAFLCELDPLYCDQIVRRWQAYAHDDAILEASGESFEHLATNKPFSKPTISGDYHNPSSVSAE